VLCVVPITPQTGTSSSPISHENLISCIEIPMEVGISLSSLADCRNCTEQRASLLYGIPRDLAAARLGIMRNFGTGFGATIVIGGGVKSLCTII
jgi:hypothetical protein